MNTDFESYNNKNLFRSPDNGIISWLDDYKVLIIGVDKDNEGVISGIDKNVELWATENKLISNLHLDYIINHKYPEGIIVTQNEAINAITTPGRKLYPISPENLELLFKNSEKYPDPKLGPLYRHPESGNIYSVDGIKIGEDVDNNKLIKIKDYNKIQIIFDEYPLTLFKASWFDEHGKLIPITYSEKFVDEAHDFLEWNRYLSEDDDYLSEDNCLMFLEKIFEIFDNYEQLDNEEYWMVENNDDPDNRINIITSYGQICKWYLDVHRGYTYNLECVFNMLNKPNLTTDNYSRRFTVTDIINENFKFSPDRIDFDGYGYMYKNDPIDHRRHRMVCCYKHVLSILYDR